MAEKTAGTDKVWRNYVTITLLSFAADQLSLAYLDHWKVNLPPF